MDEHTLTLAARGLLAEIRAGRTLDEIVKRTPETTEEAWRQVVRGLAELKDMGIITGRVEVAG